MSLSPLVMGLVVAGAVVDFHLRPRRRAINIMGILTGGGGCDPFGRAVCAGLQCGERDHVPFAPVSGKFGAERKLVVVRVVQ